MVAGPPRLLEPSPKWQLDGGYPWLLLVFSKVHSLQAAEGSVSHSRPAPCRIYQSCILPLATQASAPTREMGLASLSVPSRLGSLGLAPGLGSLLNSQHPGPGGFSMFAE